MCFYDPFENSLQRDHHAFGIIKVNLTPAHHLCVFFSLILADNLVITQLLPLCACFHVSSTYLCICKGGNLHICSHLPRPDAFLRFNWQHIPECVSPLSRRLMGARPSVWKQLGSVTSAGCSLPIRFSTFSQNRPTFFSFFNPRCFFPPQTSISGSHSLPTFTARKLRQQHSTLFHASPGVTDSKQHFSPPFFCSMENSCPYITLEPG